MFTAVIAPVSVTNTDAASVSVIAARGLLFFPKGGNGNKKRPFPVIICVSFTFMRRFRY